MLPRGHLDRAAVPPFLFLSRQKRHRLQSGNVDGSTPAAYPPMAAASAAAGGEAAAAAAAAVAITTAAAAAEGEAEAEAGTVEAAAEAEGVSGCDGGETLWRLSEEICMFVHLRSMQHLRCVPEPPNLTLLWQEMQTPQSSRVQPWHSPQRCRRSFALEEESRSDGSATTRCGDGSDAATGMFAMTSAAITRGSAGLCSSAIPVAACAEAKALSSSSVIA